MSYEQDKVYGKSTRDIYVNTRDLRALCISQGQEVTGAQMHSLQKLFVAGLLEIEAQPAETVLLSIDDVLQK